MDEAYFGVLNGDIRDKRIELIGNTLPAMFVLDML